MPTMRRSVWAGVLPIRPAEAAARVVGQQENAGQFAHFAHELPEHIGIERAALRGVHAHRKRLAPAAARMIDARASKLRIFFEERLWKIPGHVKMRRRP